MITDNIWDCFSLMVCVLLLHTELRHYCIAGCSLSLRFSEIPLLLGHNWSWPFSSAWLMCIIERHGTWIASCNVINVYRVEEKGDAIEYPDSTVTYIPA